MKEKRPLKVIAASGLDGSDRGVLAALRCIRLGLVWAGVRLCFGNGEFGTVGRDHSDRSCSCVCRFPHWSQHRSPHCSAGNPRVLFSTEPLVWCIGLNCGRSFPYRVAASAQSAPVLRAAVSSLRCCHPRLEFRVTHVRRRREAGGG